MEKSTAHTRARNIEAQRRFQRRRKVIPARLSFGHLAFHVLEVETLGGRWNASFEFQGQVKAAAQAKATINLWQETELIQHDNAETTWVSVDK